MRYTESVRDCARSEFPAIEAGFRGSFYRGFDRNAALQFDVPVPNVVSLIAAIVRVRTPIPEKQIASRIKITEKQKNI
jgi:hypothetical protein